jgi:aminoglycoside N3'-acetyltransferase
MNAKSNFDSLVRIEISKDRIIEDLRKIGITEGDHVAVALSFKSIGYVKGGPEAFIEALLEAVGPDGTIMMNTYSQSFVTSEIATGHIFDPKSTPVHTGLVPETFRKYRNSIRSLHPVLSVTANGKLAKYLTNGHRKSLDPYVPYLRLAKAGGKYLAIGLGNRLAAIRHEAQYRAGLFFKVPLYMGVRYKDKKGNVKIFLYNYPPCPKKLTELVPNLIRMRILSEGKIGNANSLIASARELINSMTNMLKENPTLSLCDNMYCLRCRELERTMNLYQKIKNPKTFQRNLILRKAIAIRNRFLLQNHGHTPFDYSEKGLLELIMTSEVYISRLIKSLVSKI